MGFSVISQIADFVYKCDEYYNPRDTGATGVGMIQI